MPTTDDLQAFADWLRGAASGHLAVTVVGTQMCIRSDRDDYDGEMAVLNTYGMLGEEWLHKDGQG